MKERLTFVYTGEYKQSKLSFKKERMNFIDNLEVEVHECDDYDFAPERIVSEENEYYRGIIYHGEFSRKEIREIEYRKYKGHTYKVFNNTINGAIVGPAGIAALEDRLKDVAMSSKIASIDLPKKRMSPNAVVVKTNRDSVIEKIREAAANYVLFEGKVWERCDLDLVA